MKRIYYILLAALLSLFALASCVKDEPKVDIEGEWYGTLIISKEKVADVYLSFSAGKFVIYQKTGSQTRYYKYEGVYTLTEDVLSGRYNDGTAMGSEYSLRREGDSLLLTALNGSDETTIYIKTAIPEEIKHTALPPVKSGELTETKIL